MMLHEEEEDTAIAVKLQFYNLIVASFTLGKS